MDGNPRDEDLTKRKPAEMHGEEQATLVPVRVYDRAGQMVERPQWVIEEEPITLYLNGVEMVTLLCAGHHLEELAAGFFYAEGFLQSLEELESIRVEAEAARVDVFTREARKVLSPTWNKRVVTSGCGKGTAFFHVLDDLLSHPVVSSLFLSARQVLERMEDLNRLSETYRRTHGVHNTLLATPERLLLFRDDIGRHNAVDMLVGYAFLHGMSLADKLLLTTGRLTSEIIIKAAKAGLPVIVSRNTATVLAVELAQALGMTLIGYVRGGKFILYCGEDRLRNDSESTGARENS